MKITHLTTLKHKLQWLVLLTALLGVSQGGWGASRTYDGSERLYFNMAAVNWWICNSGDGNFAYFYGSSGNAWSAHSVQVSGDYYYVVVPSGTWDHVILTRNNTTTSPSWDNKYNQTGDLGLSSTKNYISAFSENSDSATWGYYAPAPSSVTASVTDYTGGAGTEVSPYTVTVGNTYTITLTPSGTDSGLTYYYSFDNKSTSSTTGTKDVTPGSTGTTQHSGLYVRSCAKDGSTYSSWVQSSPTSIWVQAVSSCTPPSAPTSVTASPSTICNGSSSSLSATVASGTLKWWNAETGGTQVGTNTNLSVSPSTTTVYWAEADNGSCASSRVSVTVTVNALPSLSLGLSPSTVYPWDVATITATTTCTESTLVWKLYQGESLITTGAGSGSTYTFGKTSNTVYTLKGISSSGSGSSVTYTVKVDGNNGTCNAAQATKDITISAAASEDCGY